MSKKIPRELKEYLEDKFGEFADWGINNQRDFNKWDRRLRIALRKFPEFTKFINKVAEEAYMAGVCLKQMDSYDVKGGVFEQAFNNIPKEYLLPWSCSDLELKKANQQPRSAYKCEPCKVSVSGKPEQLIKCGNCGNDLLELVKVPNGI